MDGDWRPVESGELVKHWQSLRTRRTRRQFLRATLVAAPAAIGLFAIVHLLTQESHSELACADVAALVDDYVRNRLDAERRQQVDWHLAHCPKCRTVIEQRNRIRAERSVS